jgi:universal stress protein E
MNTKTANPDMSSITNKLFVIIDPTVKRQIALEKALLVASMGHCAIHAFVCTYAELSEHGEFSSRKDLKLHMQDKAEQQLDQVMTRCSDNNVPFSAEVVWNKNWYEMAAQAVARSSCDLVVKSSFHHSKATRYFYRTSDFYLMRYCPSPVLFAHQSQPWQSNNLLACVDLESGDAEHMQLNNRIIKNAKVLSKTLGMELYIAAAYKEGFDSSVLQLVVESSGGTKETLAGVFGVAVDRMLLRRGDTVETIHSISEELNAAIMIIGSVARTGIAGKIIGNTAEKLLDIANADIVTIS